MHISKKNTKENINKGSKSKKIRIWLTFDGQVDICHHVGTLDAIEVSASLALYMCITR